MEGMRSDTAIICHEKSREKRPLTGFHSVMMKDTWEEFSKLGDGVLASVLQLRRITTLRISRGQHLSNRDGFTPILAFLQ